jgi:hypothetical protein
MSETGAFRREPSEPEDLWRGILDIEIELDDEERLNRIATDDSIPIDEDELAVVQASVFSRLGIKSRTEAPGPFATFLTDLELWRVGTSGLALARDVGSIVETVVVEVPELRQHGFEGVVELECDLDEDDRVSHIDVMVPGGGDGIQINVSLVAPDGITHTVPLSAFGQAQFDDLAIKREPGKSLRFELSAR